MTEEHALELQAALGQALVADPRIAALVSERVYDEPPNHAPLLHPHRWHRAASCACAGLPGRSIDVLDRGHSRSEEGSGRVEATRIGEAVTAALNENEDALTSADLAVGGGQARRDPRGAYALGALTWQARSTR